MKKALSFALCLALLLAACGAPAASPAPTQPAAPSQSGPASAASTAEAEPTEPPAAQPGRKAYAPFALVTPIALSVQGSGNSHGFYEIQSNDDSSRNILFSDYSALKQVYLCASPNCEHNSAACPSWIAPAAGLVYPAATEDRLFILHSNLDDFSYVEVADLDGANRRTLYTFPSSVEISAGMAYNGEYLAFFATTYVENEDNTISSFPALYAVNCDTGECETIHSFDALDTAAYSEGASVSFWMGVSDTGFIVKTITVGAPETMLANGKILGGDPNQHQLFEIPFDGQPMHKVFAYASEECYEEPNGAYLYYLQNKGAGHTALKRVHTATLQTETVVPDFADLGDTTCIPDCEFYNLYIAGFVDDWVILTALAQATTLSNGNIEYIYKNYAVDGGTGQVLPLTLGNYYNVAQYPLQILAQTGSDLLVYAKVTEQRADTQGLVYTATKYPGLISKQDYFANNPSYRMIDLAA